VQIFGIVSSPTICSYALRRTGADNEVDFPGVTNRIVNYFYVDNNDMESFDDQAEAMYVSKQLREWLLCGGFKLTQWSSAYKTILSSLPEPLLSKPTLNWTWTTSRRSERLVSPGTVKVTHSNSK
jgi:hypothetical protein